MSAAYFIRFNFVLRNLLISDVTHNVIANNTHCSKKWMVHGVVKNMKNNFLSLHLKNF